MSRSPAARMPLLLTLLLALALALPSAAVAAKRPDQAKRAKALAGQLERARTFEARRKALLRVLRALGTGVYTGKGRALVRGAERRTGVFAYDLEVRGLAHQLGARTLLDAEAVAQRFGAFGLRRRDGAALTGADLTGPLSAAVKRARAKRRSKEALGTLLLAELGRRGKRPVSGAGAKFDALQVWILAAELAAIRERGVRAAAAQTAAKPCFAGQRRAGKIVDGLGITSDLLEDATKFLAGWVAGPIHGVGLAGLIEFKVTESGQQRSTHYGTGHPTTLGGTPGATMTFQVQVRMHVDAPERLIRCGPLLGMRVPKKGPIPDIPIVWDGIASSGISILNQHGVITRQDEKTGPDGIAALHFRPHDEPLPDVGEERLIVASLQPEAEVLTGLGNKFGNFNEVVNGFYVTMAYDIGLHVARGYAFAAETDEICFYIDFCGEESERASVLYTAKKCGWNPYNGPWRSQMITHSNQADDDTVDFEWVLKQNETSTWFHPPDESIDNRVDFTLLPGIPPMMQVDSVYSNNLAPGSPNYRRFTDHKIREVSELYSCPEVPRLAGQVKP